MGMRKRIVVGILMASLAIAGLVVVAMAQGGMMGKRGTGTAAGAATCTQTASGTCPMTGTQCPNPEAANGSGAAACQSLGAGQAVAGSCHATPAAGACRMMGGSAARGSCPMGRSVGGV